MARSLAVRIQASVVRYSGLRLPRITALTYVLVSTIAAVVGLILTSTVTEDSASESAAPAEDDPLKAMQDALEAAPAN